MNANLGSPAPRRVLLDVDTGTDDAGALWCAATHPAFELVAVTTTWGNTSQSQTMRNTIALLEAFGASIVPVHPGASGPRGGAPTTRGAEVVMGDDGLGNVGVAPTADASVGRAADERAAEAIVRLAHASPGELTLVALAPLSTIAAALIMDPDLPPLFRDVVVMGGAVRAPGNITAVAEANIGHDPDAAAIVFGAFGRAPLASGRRPHLVPLDVTLHAPLTTDELTAVDRSPLPGGATMHKVWSAIWPTGRIELGEQGEGRWPCHDLLALWTFVDRDCCIWVDAPLTVDTGRSAAWGATVVDRRGRYAPQGAAVWSIALRVDASRYRDGVRNWLRGRGSRP